MIYGIGIDIVNIPQFRTAIERWGDRFKNRVFTERELEYCNGRKFAEQHLAARFAAKEAFFKAIGRAVRFSDVEIANDKYGKPCIVFKPEIFLTNPIAPPLIKGRQRGLSKLRTHLTLSHDGDYCVAQVIIEVGK